MKNYKILFLIFSLVQSIFAESTFKHRLFEQDGTPTKSLQSLVMQWKFNVRHDQSWYLSYCALPAQEQREALIAMTQKEWLRQAGKERWEIEDYKLDTGTKELLLSLFNDLCCCQEVRPTKKKYKGIIILGGILQRVCIRYAYLKKLWQEGVRADAIFLFGGERPMDKKFEKACSFLGLRDNEFLPMSSVRWENCLPLPTNEAQMMQWVMKLADLPQELRAVPVHTITSRMKIAPDGSAKRPTTGDTFNDWGREYNPEGDYLVISSQPFIGYQDAVGRSSVAQKVYLETVGLAVNTHKQLNFCNEVEDTTIAEYFDTIARWMWQENQLINKQP
jgi:hypothetical protein